MGDVDMTIPEGAKANSEQVQEYGRKAPVVSGNALMPTFPSGTFGK